MEKKNDNEIFIGDKDIFRYSNAVRIVLENFDNAIVRARGKNVNKALDLLYMNLSDNIKIEIKINKEKMKNKDDNMRLVRIFDAIITKQTL